VREEDDEDEEIAVVNNSKFVEKYPLRAKSTCCSEILLLSLSDLLPLMENQIGFKCDEAFLEDSALRLLKSSFRKNNCQCSSYSYIFIDLDDPTIMLQRFLKSVD